MKLVDVHTHLTHQEFDGQVDQVIQQSMDDGLSAIVVNGLNPASNRQILAMKDKHPAIKAALGIYPLDAINHLDLNLQFEVEKFDVQAEISFIRDQAASGQIVAIGECGLDGYWVGEETFAAQEHVLEQLIEIALDHDLPIINHSRKREVRMMEILSHFKCPKVNFHCFGGRTKHAIKWAEDHGWYFSIPANAQRNEAFRKMLKSLPIDRILTETDAPYLGPEKGVRNYPGNVKHTIALLAELRSFSIEQASEQVWQNYERLFNSRS